MRKEFHNVYLTPGFIGFSGDKLYHKHKTWLSKKHKYYKPNGQPIPEKNLSQDLVDEKKRYAHPNPPVGIVADVKTIVPPTWMHAMIHSMVLINILIMLLINRRDKQWGKIVAALKLQYNYLENGDIVTCGDEVLQFVKKFRVV